MNLRCLVVDDDPLIGDLIKHFCAKSVQVSFCISALTAKDGLNLLATDGIDLVFLDFNLPDMTGQEFLEMMPFKIPVIMVTSESHFGVKSYEYKQVFDYLIKPLTFDRFEKAIERVVINKTVSEIQTPDEEHLFLKDGTKLVRIELKDLLFIKSEGNYANFIQENSQTMNIISMKDLEVKLPSYFVRVHRSYIVNLKKIKVILSDEIIVNDRQIPIGDKYRAELLKLIKEF